MSYYKSAAGFFKVGFDSDAQAYFTAAGITDATQKSAWNTVVVSAKANGWWSKMYVLFPFLGGTSTSHSYNAVNPASNQITWNGTVTHNSNGITGDGSTGYGVLSFNSNLSGGGFWTPTSGSFGCYGRTSLNSGGISMGNNGQNTYIYYTGGTLYYGYGGLTIPVSLGSSTRLVLATTISGISSYRDGTLQGNAAGTPSGTASLFNLLSYDGSTYFSNQNIAFAFLGQGLNSTDITNMTNAINTFQTALGRNV